MQQQQQQPAPPAAAADAPAPRPPPADSEDADSEVDAAEAQQYAAAALAAYSGQGPVPAELQWRQQARFLSEPDPDDPVVKSHYRMIRSFTADDPAPLVEGAAAAGAPLGCWLACWWWSSVAADRPSAHACPCMPC